jgi:hypothetical protein
MLYDVLIEIVIRVQANEEDFDAAEKSALSYVPECWKPEVMAIDPADD